METDTFQLRPDAKGRISLGQLAKGVSSFRAKRTEDGNILLEPFAEIPAREKWLFENPIALEGVRRGLREASEGKAVSRGSFVQYAEEQSE